eukprot:scaffold17432_cov21-Tisochrysis_lutea.AAC.1
MSSTFPPAQVKHFDTHSMSSIFPPLQVKHFDTQQEVSARRARQLRAAIDSQATSAAGSLSGKAA